MTRPLINAVKASWPAWNFDSKPNIRTKPLIVIWSVQPSVQPEQILMKHWRCR